MHEDHPSQQPPGALPESHGVLCPGRVSPVAYKRGNGFQPTPAPSAVPITSQVVRGRWERFLLVQDGATYYRVRAAWGPL